MLASAPGHVNVPVHGIPMNLDPFVQTQETLWWKLPVGWGYERIKALAG